MKATFKNNLTRRSATIELSEATDWHLMETLTHALDFVTGSPQGHEVPVDVQVTVKGPEVPELRERVQTALQELRQEHPKPEAPAISRPHTYPKVNASESMQTTLGDLLRPEVKEKLANATKPDLEKWPGKKVFDTPTGPVTTYQCRYYCKDLNCGHKGLRWVRENQSYVKCHECNTKLQVRPATPQGFPNRDDYGNFFIADSLYVEETLGPQS